MKRLIPPIAGLAGAGGNFIDEIVYFIDNTSHYVALFGAAAFFSLILATWKVVAAGTTLYGWCISFCGV